MDGRSATQPVGYLPAQMYQRHAQAEGDDESEYSRPPDISTTGVGSSQRYPPTLTPSGAQTAPIQGSSIPHHDYWSDSHAKPAVGVAYTPVPAAPGGPTASFPSQYPPVGARTDASSSYAANPDTVLQMGVVKPSYAQPSANNEDAPYRPYSPARNGRPVRPGAPNGNANRPSGGAVPAPYDNDRWQQDVRRGFVRKVLLLVAIQLLITTGVSITFFTVQPIKDYLQVNQWPVWVAMIISFGILFTIVCFPKTHKFPFDYMLLFGFTIFFSVVVGAITGRYSVQAVGLALAVTCATVFGAFFVAAFTKMDLTKIGGFLTAILFGVIVMSIIGIFWRNRWFNFAIALVSAVLFTMFLIYDLQMLMGGRSRQFDPDMYVIAALNIYLDIIQIFLNVLQIIGLVGGGGD